MTRTTCHISISLDGFVAGPDQSRENPIGAGGLRLHQWHQQADEPGHEADIAPRDELMTPRGAYIMGRNMFGPIRGEWDEDWRGLHHLRPRSDPVLPDRRHRVDALRRLPLRGKETYDAEIENPGFQGSLDLRVVRLVEQDDVVMANSSAKSTASTDR